MLEVLVIMGVILVILTFFYKQAVCEFRMNQMEWAQKDQIRPLLQESVPLVIRGIPPLSCWTRDDVMTRDCYADLPLFQEMSLVEWMKSATPESGCPWKYAQAQQIARTSGLSVWAAKTMNPVIISPVKRAWWWPRWIFVCRPKRRIRHRWRISITLCAGSSNVRVIYVAAPRASASWAVRAAVIRPR